MYNPLAAALSLVTVLAATERLPAQPRPSQPPAQQPGPRPGMPPQGQPGGAMPGGSGTASAASAPVPNAPAPVSEVGGRKFEEWLREVENPDPSVRAEAIRIIVQFGPAPRRAIPALVKQVKQLNDLSPQAMAIIALSEIVPLTPPPAPGGTPDGYTTDAVNALVQALDSP